MQKKHRILIRVALFIAVFALVFTVVNRFFQPVWVRWDNYNATYGFYEQPKNTIETLVLGVSVAGTGVVAPELYNEYGICAYQISTQSQPIAAAYTWLQEAYRLHGNTLKTVVLDVSTLRRAQEASFFHIATDPIRFSPVKYRAYRDFFGTGFNETLSMMVPLYNYHDRWSELTVEDFDKFTYTPTHGSRGYHFIYSTYEERMANGTMEYFTLNFDEARLATALDEESVAVLDQMIAFCNEKGLTLVLIRTPALNWSEELHALVQQLADEKGLAFLDFNYGSYAEEIAFVPETESTDLVHLNYYGACKVTHVLGRYLQEELNATDVRGDKRYAFMQTEYEEFRYTTDLTLRLHNAATVTDYLTIAAGEGLTVLISLKDEAAYGLTQQERDQFAVLGLTELSNLVYRNAYLGIMQDGYTIYESRKTDADGNTPITHADKLANGAAARLVSGSFGEGNRSSITIQGVEHSQNLRGLNIVVYSTRYDRVLHTACFDTNQSGSTMYTPNRFANDAVAD